nr:hypothetical protein [Streptomyces sp. SBT349]
MTETTPRADPDDAASALSTTTTLDPRRGLPTQTTDANGNVTVQSYDALGRSARVWLPDRRTAQAPSFEFTYRVEEGHPVSVGSRALNNSGGQTSTSYTLYDGLLRARQTQQPGPEDGMLLSDTFYDERGLVRQTFASYFAEGDPAPEVFKPTDLANVQTQTRHAYDALGRETESVQVAGDSDGGEVLATTTTSYRGDRVTVIPPEGAPPPRPSPTPVAARSNCVSIANVHRTPTSTPPPTPTPRPGRSRRSPTRPVTTGRSPMTNSAARSRPPIPTPAGQPAHTTTAVS